MDGLWQDVKYAFRTLSRRPAFVFMAVLTLTLGIGANTAVFSVINGVLLQPLPYPDPDRIVAIWSTHRVRGWNRSASSVQNFTDWKKQSQLFGAMSIFYPRSGNLTGGTEPRNIPYALVTPGFFKVFGVEPLFGRGFLESENVPGQDGVAVISYNLWQGVLAGRPDVAGSMIDLDTQRIQVIGVMPASFSFPEGVQLWKPFGMGPEDGGQRSSFWVYAVGRLDSETSLQAAQAEMDTIAAALEERYPDSNESVGVFLEPLRSATVFSIQSALFFLWACVAIVLLIACTNVANLVLTRSIARQREIEIRRALGASRVKLLRQALCENLLLSLTGGMAATLLGYLGTKTLLGFTGNLIPRSNEVGLDFSVLAFTGALALFSGCAFGILPLLRGQSTDLADGLREGQRLTAGRRVFWVRKCLAGIQFALAVALLIGASLFGISFYRVIQVDPGYNGENVLTLRVEPPMKLSPGGMDEEEFFRRYGQERSQISSFYTGLLNRLESGPGVRSAGAINRLPLSGNMWGTRIYIEGQSVEKPADGYRAFARVVTPGYFKTLQIPILLGRNFRQSDREGNQKVVVISQTLAKDYFPGQDPLGERITFVYPPREDLMFTIVGIAGDIRHGSLEAPVGPIIYTHLPQSLFGFFGNWGMDLVLKTEVDPSMVSGAARQTIREIDPDLPAFSIQSMNEVTENQLTSRRFSTVLLSTFGVLSLVLAAVGIYGVISYSVKQRENELGIRMALGASRRKIVLMVLREGLVTSLMGVSIGAFGAFFVAGYIEGFLYQTSSREPLVFAAVPLFLLLISCLACVIPARRAARLNTIQALRSS